ncbi:MAG: 30S ribosomal protein S6 [Anaerolineae bacterium]
METRNYELMFIVNPELAEEELDTLLQRVQRYLDDANARVFSFKSWGLRRLAYIIQGHREGRYYLVHFAADSETINNLDRNLRLIENIIRHLITKLEGVPITESSDEAQEEVQETQSEATEETVQA